MSASLGVAPPVMINSKNVIIVASIDWSFNWQGPQEIALRLAQEGNRVLYVENLGVRSPQLKDASRVWQRLKRWFRSVTTSEIAEVAPNLFICSPIVMPPFGSRWQKFINRRFFLPAIKRVAKKMGMDNPDVWSFLPTDTVHDLIMLLREEQSTVVYYVAGDFEPLVFDVEKLRRSDRKIAESSDVILTIHSTLTNRYTDFHSNVHTLPYGVDLSAFQKKAKSEISESIQILLAKLKAKKNPIIGYIGGLHRFVNMEMLCQSAIAKPDWSWVFVGPVQENFDKLKALPNVLFLGAQPHNDLVTFISDFDVCIIPYTDVAYTKTVVPVKLNEYLAAGKPVVATDIPSIREFNNEHKVVNVCGNNTEEFLFAIEKCLKSEETAKSVENRKRVAQLSDWQTRFNNICQVINAAHQDRDYETAKNK